MPDPGDPEKRNQILERLAGKLVRKVERKRMPDGKVVERERWETVGGILHWKRETENKEDLAWFRNEIRKAYGGRAPRLLDPFAGGGSIPLEGMRLGCEVTAVDINPVAWFILKCTLEYPQKLAGQTWPLPDFVLKDRDFMASFFKARGFKGAVLRTQLEKLGLGEQGEEMLPGLEIESPTLEADLAWHVRAWGWWVLQQARKELARFYPVYADFQPLRDVDEWRQKYPDQQQPMQPVPLRDDGKPDIETLNTDFDETYLRDPRNPRWVSKPAVAYLWARTVRCKNCRATIPLLKTCWLSTKESRRVLLAMRPNEQRTAVLFEIQARVPHAGHHASQRRDHDRLIGTGTMTRAGVFCPCCGRPDTVAMTMDDIRREGMANRIGTHLTAVVVEGKEGREYRTPTPEEIKCSQRAARELDRVFSNLPHGRIHEPLEPESTRSISCQLYGLDNYSKLFTARQQLALGILINCSRSAVGTMRRTGFSDDFVDAVYDYLAVGIDRVADRLSVFCRPDPTPTQSGVINTFSKFALPMTWDFIEGVATADSSGGYGKAMEWIAQVIEHLLAAESDVPRPEVEVGSADQRKVVKDVDLVVTDPPYYEAISYGDLSDFFYIWQRRIHDNEPFSGALTDKKPEIVQHVRADKVKSLEKQKYENRMYEAFCRTREALVDDGRFVLVFAHKNAGAWETLVRALVRAGFVVTASWPIQTEMPNRGRAIATAALASSLWLVCRKRSDAVLAGWDHHVLREMRKRISVCLENFWEAGIRGPDFVWAATGPALEAYSKYPMVKKANEPGEPMEVSEFLQHVRRFVVDFVVSRVLTGDGVADAVNDLDPVTSYYLLHRNYEREFQVNQMPAGPCILYAVSCGLSERELTDKYDVLVRTGAPSAIEEEEPVGADSAAESEVEGGSSRTFCLKPWKQRQRRKRRFASEAKNEVPLIDQIHRLMHLWKAGDVYDVDDFLDLCGLRRSPLFLQVLQSLIELSAERSEERSLFESISNHVAARGTAPAPEQKLFEEPAEDDQPVGIEEA